MPDSSALQRVAELLLTLGYRAQLREEFGYIKTGVSGVKAGVYVFDDSIHISSIFTDSDISPAQANAYNQLYRFSKIFVDEDRVLSLVVDHLVDVSGPEMQTFLEKALLNYEGAIAMFRQFMSDLKDEDIESGDDASDAE